MSKSITTATFGSILAPAIVSAMNGVADKLNGRNSKEDITGAQVLAYFEEALADSTPATSSGGKGATSASTCTFKGPRAKKACGASSAEEIDGANYCTKHADEVKEANGAEPEEKEEKPATKPAAKAKAKAKSKSKGPDFTDVAKDADSKTDGKEAAAVAETGSDAEEEPAPKVKPAVKKETKTAEEKPAKPGKDAKKPEPPKEGKEAPPKPDEAKKSGKTATTTASVIQKLKADSIPTSDKKKEVDDIIDAAGASGKKAKPPAKESKPAAKETKPAAKPAAKSKAKVKDESSAEESGSEDA